MNSHSTGPHQWRIIGDVLVALTSEGVIDKDTWARYIDVLHNGDFRVNLAISHDGAISSTQRKGASEAIKSRKLSVIVLTDSRVTRGIVTALNWLGSEIAAFSFDELDGVLEALEVKPEIEQEIRELALEFLHRHVNPH